MPSARVKPLIVRFVLTTGFDFWYMSITVTYAEEPFTPAVYM